MPEYAMTQAEHDDPLVDLFGYRRPRGKPMIYVHKLVLYRKIGAGTHPCHWCGKELEWKRGTAGNALICDHLDGDPSNNDPGNLVPACNGCNTIRARSSFRPAIADGELWVETSKGRTRAVEIVCEVCGKTCLVHISRSKRGTATVCSRSCAGKKSARLRWGLPVQD